MLGIDETAEVVASAVREATAPLLARLAAMEARELPAPVASVGEAEVRAMVEAAVAALPPAQDGKSVGLDEVRAMVSEAVAALPPAQDGKSVEPDEVRAMVSEAVAALPPAQDGKSIEPGEVRAMVSEAVAALPAPKDGVGLAGAFKDHEGCLILTMTDGSTHKLGRIDGEKGRDGLGFDDLSVEQVGERTVRFLLQRGAEKAEFDLTLPVPVYRGVFKDAGAYETGDLVTWGGSLWHCNEPKGLKPGAPNSGWQLAAKAGRPGKDAADV